MKKRISLLLVLALILTLLPSCARIRAKREENRRAAEGEAEATEAPLEDISFDPEGPGYTITDASNVSSEMGDAQPTLQPAETLTPQEMAVVTGETAVPSGDETGDVAAGEGDEFVMGTYDEATDAAQHEDQPAVISPNAFQFSAVVDDNLDYTFNYPTEWENVPGIYTVCYREKVEPGDFPARVAITRKRLVHTPDEAAILEQLSSYMKSIYKQYDKETFQTSTPNKEATFMGKKALSNYYLAYWGEEEVKGFVIGTAFQRTLYVFHFCATYADFTAMESLVQYMMNSVRLKNPPKGK